MLQKYQLESGFGFYCSFQVFCKQEFKMWSQQSLKPQRQKWDILQKFSRSLVHKKNFGLSWQVVFKLEYLFRQGW